MFSYDTLVASETLVQTWLSKPTSHRCLVVIELLHEAMVSRKRYSASEMLVVFRSPQPASQGYLLIIELLPGIMLSRKRHGASEMLVMSATCILEMCDHL